MSSPSLSQKSKKKKKLLLSSSVALSGTATFACVPRGIGNIDSGSLTRNCGIGSCFLGCQCFLANDMVDLCQYGLERLLNIGGF
jgi:hypothetical protein